MLALLLAFLPGAEPAPFAVELATIRAVSKEGTGNEAAAKAWAKLVAAGEPALLPILEAFEGSTPATQNWLRTATDSIAEQSKGKLDAAKLATFTGDSKRHPAARRIAFELLKEQDAKAAVELLNGFTTDPNLELRRDAIAAQLAMAKDVASIQKLFAASRDKDQVEEIAKKLKEQKQEANITKHFGYVTQWNLIGPFDNKEGKGFTAAQGPEKALDVAAKWLPAQSSATYGTIDLNTAIGKHKDSVGYAMATILADTETKAELRVASQNAVKFFVNGEQVFAREEYHHGTRMDQHTAAITLKKGENTILLKICQNDMSFSWAQAWGFAARICDSTGGALPVQQSIGGQKIELGNLAEAKKQ